MNEVTRESREFDTTSLRASGHGRAMGRDYLAHAGRWAFARRFITLEDTVLEVGCGVDMPLSRILTGGAAPHVKHYVGVDLNKLKPSNSKRLTFLGEFNFIDRWAEVLALCPEGYDVIVNMEVIEHMTVEHGQELLAATRKCLKPGGTLLLSTPCYDGVRHAKNHIHEYTVPELHDYITAAGFTVERRFGTFMDLKEITRQAPEGCDHDAVVQVYNALKAYHDNEFLSAIFAPLYPNNARNNLWICKKACTNS